MTIKLTNGEQIKATSIDGFGSLAMRITTPEGIVKVIYYFTVNQIVD